MKKIWLALFLFALAAGYGFCGWWGIFSVMVAALIIEGAVIACRLQDLRGLCPWENQDNVCQRCGAPPNGNACGHG